VRPVQDDPQDPDPGFAELYTSLPDATDLEPWLGWCRRARGPVLYLGIGAGRLAVPLHASGVPIVGVDAHPEMLAHLRSRLPGVELVQQRIEDLALGRRFDLVVAPSNILYTRQRLAAAALHADRRVAFELVNPHWLLAGRVTGVRLGAVTEDRAEIEVDYEGGFTQLGALELVWPESIEGFLGSAGLELEVMRGHDGDDLDESPSFFVLARRAGP
jgi:hypothetical protein